MKITSCLSSFIRASLILAGLVVMAAPSAVQAKESLNVPPAGFTALFNGQDLSGWWGASTENPRQWSELSSEAFEQKRQKSLADVRANWSVQNGELVNGGEGLYLTSERQFGDAEYLIEYRTVAGADSGVYLRGCPQVQIWDYTEAGGKWKLGADKGSGGLWNNSPGAPGKDPLVFADKPFGEWNQLRIVQCGSRTWVWLNSKLVVDGVIMENYFDKARKVPIPATGPIQLQTHGGEIRWRNVFVRELKAEEANQWLRGKDPAGFETVFNGRDFTGWSGALQNYVVKDGAITCQAGKGGTVYTTKDYADFVARVEFKLPPAGNNGLAIRYPGEGDPAYVGMCELQVLDDSAVKYAKLDQRQYTGSAYGMVGAHRGYVRPAGEWNYQEVTVKGSTIKVELNGTVILNCDLNDVTEFMADRAHPGKNRTTGGFGFAGHNDPVMFRNISIKSL